MKTFVGILTLLLATSLAALAEESQFQELKARLSLTAEQAVQVRPVLEELPRILKAVRDDANGGTVSPSTRRRLARELRAIQSHAEGKLERILSREQMDELRRICRERGDRS